ncbi:hypothetical protein HDG42_002100 [Paraburkholderia sp. JPY171]|nr:hypothetical protein [Paraburkholderia atlantica]
MRKQQLQAPRRFGGLAATREQTHGREFLAAVGGDAEFVVELADHCAVWRFGTQACERRLRGLRFPEAQFDAHLLGEQGRIAGRGEQCLVNRLQREVVAMFGRPHARGREQALRGGVSWRRYGWRSSGRRRCTDGGRARGRAHRFCLPRVAVCVTRHRRGACACAREHAEARRARYCGAARHDVLQCGSRVPSAAKR